MTKLNAFNFSIRDQGTILHSYTHATFNNCKNWMLLFIYGWHQTTNILTADYTIHLKNKKSHPHHHHIKSFSHFIQEKLWSFRSCKNRVVNSVNCHTVCSTVWMNFRPQYFLAWLVLVYSRKKKLFLSLSLKGSTLTVRLLDLTLFWTWQTNTLQDSAWGPSSEVVSSIMMCHNECERSIMMLGVES